MKAWFSVLLVVLVVAFGGVALAQEGQVTISDITGDSAAYYGQTVTVDGVITELLNVRAFVISDQNIIDNQLLVVNNTGREFDLRVTAGQRVIVTGIVHPHAAEGGLSQIVSALPGPDTGMTTGTTNTGAAQPEATVDPAMEVTAEATVDPAMEATAEVMDDASMQATEDPMAEATEDPAMQPTPMTDMTNSDMTGTNGMFQMDAIDLSTMVIPDRLQQHTIVELIAIQDITFVDEEAQQ